MGIMLISGLAIAGLCFAAWRATVPPTTPPDYEGARPDPREHGYVTVTDSVLIAAAPADVWAWSNDPTRTLEDIVQFDSGFPAVVGTEPLVGRWEPGEREGDRRRVQFADGHYLAEEVLVDSDDTFRYMIWGFTSAQRFAVRHGVAEFQYHAEADGTRVTWTYSLLPTLGALSPLRRGVRRFHACADDACDAHRDAGRDRARRSSVRRPRRGSGCGIRSPFSSRNNADAYACRSTPFVSLTSETPASEMSAATAM